MNINKNFEYIKRINKQSKEAFKIISGSSSSDRNLAIFNTSNIIENNRSKILEANSVDIKNANAKKLSNAFIDRLILNDTRINDIINGLEQISYMNDPVGIELSRWQQPNEVTDSTQEKELHG